MGFYKGIAILGGLLGGIGVDVRGDGKFLLQVT